MKIVSRLAMPVGGRWAFKYLLTASKVFRGKSQTEAIADDGQWSVFTHVTSSHFGLLKQKKVFA